MSRTVIWLLLAPAFGFTGARLSWPYSLLGCIKSHPLLSETDSVHLKLQESVAQQSADDDKDNVVQQVAPDPGMGYLTSFINITSNATILAAQGIFCNASVARLEVFAQHRLGINLTASSAGDARIEQRAYNLRLNESIAELQALFRSERLLLQDKDFPPREPFVDGDDAGSVARAAGRKFESKLFGSARRLLDMRQQDLGWRLGDAATETHETRSVREFLESQPNVTRWRRQGDASAADMLAALKDFLLWFRAQFPYYYSACLRESCGHEGRGPNEYLGSVFPTAEELTHRAGVTELNLCLCCKQVTRFPRFNALSKMLQTRRGRCGEYSVLVMKMLEVLGYRSRWVVDWADHVWAEVELPADGHGGYGYGAGASEARWVHVDPCEASVDENLLYQGWGKNATFIFAIGKDGPVVDVTAKYTSVSPEEVERRREMEGVNTSVVDAVVGRANLLWAVGPNESI